MNYPFQTTQGYNLRQDYVNQGTQAQLADDGIIDVFVDTQGIGRGVAVPMSGENVSNILTSLNYFDSLTGIAIRFVDTEAESELSIHRLDETPGSFEQWNLDPRTKGLVHNKGPQNNNVYFEGGDPDGYTTYVIYHELAHIFGAYELVSPFEHHSTRNDHGL